MKATITAHFDLMYRSSRDPALALCTDVYVPRRPAPLLLHVHGWHGSRVHGRKIAELFAPHFVVVNVDMRGRGKSEGRPDVNGWELLDAVDALHFARRAFSRHISDPERIYCVGASGGGGNVFALVGKFPDLFTAGVALCGISDYAAWYRGDQVGEFRDDMDAWLGASPDEAPALYRSASGLYLVENLVTPLLVYHGDADLRVPVEMSRRYAARARQLGKPVTYIELPGEGHALDYPALAPQITEFLLSHTRPPRLGRRGRLAVGGYVQTRRDRLELPSLAHFAVVSYGLDPEGRLIEVQPETEYQRVALTHVQLC